jgi:hypothetical protein
MNYGKELRIHRMKTGRYLRDDQTPLKEFVLMLDEYIMNEKIDHIKLVILFF